MARRLAALTCLTVFLGACAVEPSAPPFAIRHDAIVDGEPELGEDAVVLVTAFGALGMCTGTLITPRVVLTAKHCVQGPNSERTYPPSAMTVGVGHRRGATRDYRVRYVDAEPGIYTSSRTVGIGGALIGIDVGVLVLFDDVEDVEPIPIRRDRPGDMIGESFTAIGFGRRPDGGAGEKYKGGGVVMGINDGVIYTARTICSGDSGGPMIQEGETRQVIGVASFGQAGECPSEIDGYNGVWNHLGLIDRAVLLSGECIDRGEELCNSLDDDCDGVIDEGCAAIGESCETDVDCAYAQLPDWLEPLAVTTECVDLGEGPVCARPCDPLRPEAGCDQAEVLGEPIDIEGLYCASAGGCDGWCAHGERGVAPDGTPCEADRECASLRCADPGAGGRRCLPACQGDAGHCPLFEACVAEAAECGVCVDEDILRRPRGLGESCADDAACRDGLCHEGACARACTTDAGCPFGFRCDEMRCLAGSRAGLGDPCAGNEDCVVGAFCADRGSQQWCSRFCDADEDCPADFACAEAGEVSLCAPERGLLGESCDSDEACVDGVCGEGRCGRACRANEPCPIGFACVRDGEGFARCAVPPESGGGGCSAGSAGLGSARAGALGLFGLLALGALLRRRRQHSI